MLIELERKERGPEGGDVVADVQGAFGQLAREDEEPRIGARYGTGDSGGTTATRPAQVHRATDHSAENARPKVSGCFNGM